MKSQRDTGEGGKMQVGTMVLRLPHYIRQWLKNPAQRRLGLLQQPLYWRAKGWLKVRSFKLKRQLYAAGNKWSDTKESVSVLRQLAAAVVWDVIVAILFVLVLEFLDKYVFVRMNISPVNGLTSRFSSSLGENAFVSLFSTLAQISGIFIGLYFAAISSIASAVYVRVPADVRRLMLEEKTGNIYIRTVAFLGVLSVTVLTAKAAGYTVGSFVIIATTSSPSIT